MSDDTPSLFPDSATRSLSESFINQDHRPALAAGLKALDDALRVTDTDKMLSQRGEVHGDFTDNARIAQALKYILHRSKNWDELTAFQKEALDQIASKISRILSGDANHPDHWDDIQGYARITRQRLP